MMKFKELLGTLQDLRNAQMKNQAFRVRSMSHDSISYLSKRLISLCLKFLIGNIGDNDVSPRASAEDEIQLCMKVR